MGYLHVGLEWLGPFLYIKIGVYGDSYYKVFINTIVLRFVTKGRSAILATSSSPIPVKYNINRIEGIFMNSKIKLLVAASLVTVLASGCSNGIYRSGSQNAGSGADGSYSSPTGQVSRGGQVSRNGQVSRDEQVSGSRRGGLFGQQSRESATCAPCASNTTRQQPQSTYTYTPPKKAAPAPKRAPAPQAGQHSQQWYVDRWKRQQAAGQKQQQPKKTTNYAGYGTGNYTYDAAASNNTNYYDYSTAGKKQNTNANVSTSNKSIYTGSYQQKTYKPYNPTTYSGGSSAKTNTTTTYAGSSASAGGANTYTVKKGDTVFEIMRQTGVYWKDIIRINNLQAPAYNINPGQIIRLK